MRRCHVARYFGPGEAIGLPPIRCRLRTIRYGSRDIKFGISRDDEPLETTLKLAVEVVNCLAELDKLAKKIAAKDLRDDYNAGWNEFDQAQDDGSFKTVSNAKLPEAEFEAKLTLDAVDVIGDRVIVFFYDDKGMFWGHYVIVQV